MQILNFFFFQIPLKIYVVAVYCSQIKRKNETGGDD